MLVRITGTLKVFKFVQTFILTDGLWICDDCKLLLHSGPSEEYLHVIILVAVIALIVRELDLPSLLDI